MTTRGAELCAQYEANGYALIKGLIAPDVAAVFLSMTQRSMGDTAADLAKFTDEPSIIEKPAYELYGFHFPPALSLQWGLTPFMEEATGVSLAPTYCYFRAYQQGARCRVHSDRAACEHSLTLTLGAASETVWPFTVGKNRLTDQEVEERAAFENYGDDPFATIEMNAGDAVLYQGVRHRHARPTPNPNRWSAHLFLHWVDRNGPYKDHIFDGKKLPHDVNFPFA